MVIAAQEQFDHAARAEIDIIERDLDLANQSHKRRTVNRSTRIAIDRGIDGGILEDGHGVAPLQHGALKQALHCLTVQARSPRRRSFQI